MVSDELHYPTLQACRLTLVGAAASSRPPVSLSTNCINAAENSDISVKPYDFTLERNVLKRKEEMESDQLLMTARSRDELERATLTKMKSVTGAKEDMCVAMLETNGYDLKTSIEAYYVAK